LEFGDFIKRAYKGEKMRKWSILFLLLCSAGVAFANPIIIDPIGGLAYVIVLGSAIGVEVAIITILLFFFDMSPAPVFIALFIGNLTVYFAVFLPLLDAVSNLWVAEGLIVALDGVLIKAISRYELFQLETFTQLKWEYAFLIAAVGNIVSYYVGAVISA